MQVTSITCCDLNGVPQCVESGRWGACEGVTKPPEPVWLASCSGEPAR